LGWARVGGSLHFKFSGFRLQKTATITPLQYTINYSENKRINKS
jgi:hypothetical protein